MQFPSVAEIQSQGKSLGIIKPESIEKCVTKKTSREWSSKQQAVQNQGDLFEPSVELVEKIPYQFGYKFTESDGKKHRYTISDWEISELYRKCRKNSQFSSMEEKEKEAISKVKQKLEDKLSKKELYFVVGNLKNHCDTFMIIGIFYPPKIPYSNEVQQTLNLFG